MSNGLPEVKKGDKVLIKGLHGNTNPSWIGTIVEVITPSSVGKGVITARALPNQQVTGNISLYYPRNGYNQDFFVLADRKEHAKFLKEKNQEMEESIKRNKIEIERLEKFDSEEEYVAYKIDKLLKAKGIPAKVEILKALKESNLL